MRRSYAERLGDEQLIDELRQADKEARNKNLLDAHFDILSSLSEGFGASSAVRALEGFSRLAASVVSYHPDSKSARAAGRLAYLAAGVVCESVDYVNVGAAFRTIEERRELILNAVRLGALADEDGDQALRMAMALVEKYAPGGKATAAAVRSAMHKDLERIPAEIVADQAVRLLRADQLFLAGRELEMAAYHVALPPFDQLSVPTRSMLGALLDYSGVDRERFANAWKHDASASSSTPQQMTEAMSTDVTPQGSLFSGAGK